MKNLNKKQLLMTSLLSAATLAAFAAPAAAQTAESDEIVVTGSRIAKKDFISNSPVATVNAVQFERTGAINTENLLNTLPQTVPGLDRTSNNPGNGTATVDLRGLGANRTLVLVNGRRAMPNGPGGVVDINTIAPSMIENVEVLTGGASSVYGADAVAGVVNFIMKDDFEGIEANVGYSMTQEGDAGQFNTNVTMGANTADGRGNATLHVGYTDRSALFQGDRDFAETALFDNGDSTGLEPGGSSGVPGTAIFNGGFLGRSSCGVQLSGAVDADGNLIPCPDDQLTALPGAFPNSGLIFNTNGSTRDFVLGGDVNDFYNYAPVNFIQLPQERFTVSGSANYEINNHAEVYTEARFANNTVSSQLAPTPIFQTTTFSLDGNPFIDAASQAAISGNNTNQVGIGARQARVLADPTNPFNPTPNPALMAGDVGFSLQNLCTNCVFDSNGDGFNDVAPLVDTDGDGIADTGRALLRRRLREVGPRFNSDSRNTFQMLLGVKGDFIGDWNYDVSFSEGRTQSSTFQNGNVNRGRFDQALLLADADGDGNVDVDANGNPSCSDSSANGSTSSCAPLNIFGEGNISENAAAFLRTAASTTDETIQRVAQVNFTGDLGSLRITDDAIGLAFGGEYIENAYVFRPSQDVAASTIAGFNGSPALEGKYDVYSAYAEASVPLLSGLPFAESVTLDLAGRVSDFSTSGTKYNYKIGGDWAINDQLRFRGNYNTAVRAPNIGELFAAVGENFPGGQDPCSANGAPAGGISAETRAICIATGAPAGVIGTAALDTASGQVRALSGGNVNLDVEEAETITFGAVISPDFVEGLTMSVDYYDVDITNAIGSVGAATVLFNCYVDPATRGVGGAACNAVQRRPDGSILSVSTQSANISSQAVRGIDIAANYAFDTSKLGVNLGDLDIAYLGTVNLEASGQTTAASSLGECQGKFGNACGEPDPKYRHRVTTNLSKGPWNGQIAWQLIGGVKNGITIDGVYTPPGNFVDEIGTKHYFDGSVTRDFGENLSLTFGVNNLLNSGPPVIGDNDEQANTFPATYDVFGRTFFSSAKMRF